MQKAADVEFLSTRSEIFRSKLISFFRLGESLEESKSTASSRPSFSPGDVFEGESLAKIMMSNTEDLVQIQMYSLSDKKFVTDLDRRFNRVRSRNKKALATDLWANWIVSSSVFQNSILILILINSLVLGIQTDVIAMFEGRTRYITEQCFEIFGYTALGIFVLEIMLKWVDNFKCFWKNKWNIFDFVITFASFLPEIFKVSGLMQTDDLSVVMDSLRTFRVLQSLKMVSRFQKVRLIVLAVTKAFQAMAFITALMFIFAYVFAIIGVVFLDYTNIDNLDVTYNDSFKSVLDALITLFQLMTLDHWEYVFRDVEKIGGQWFAGPFIMLWIVIGSFVFKNVFVGIMVNNFQSIRNDLFQEVEEFKERERREHEMVDFAEEIDRQNLELLKNWNTDDARRERETESGEVLHPTASKLLAGSSLHSTKSRFASVDELNEAITLHSQTKQYDAMAWQAAVEKNMENLAQEETQFCWPRDTLFCFIQSMEVLQENMTERKRLLTLAGQMLLQMQDS